MYTLYFMIGFATSFGWWSAGKVQHKIDNPTKVEQKEKPDDRRKEAS